ncbi:MAG TPA: hypothetical protein VGS13_13370 [Stellaceae bacterium]|nr:hypothetical protein [Stellaceae bacterium]
MRIAMPSMPESLTYAVVAAIGITVVAAIVRALAGPGNIVAAVLVLAVAIGIYCLIGRNLATIVTAKEVAATVAVLFVLCALGDLVTGYPYQGVLFLLAAGALGFAFLLLQQGTMPVELRFGGVLAVAGPGRRIHLRMLEELHDAGILTADELAAKRPMIEP